MEGRSKEKGGQERREGHVGEEERGKERNLMGEEERRGERTGEKGRGEGRKLDIS